jgi:tetratricopeptide (TPR) repeat protein
MPADSNSSNSRGTAKSPRKLERPVPRGIRPLTLILLAGVVGPCIALQIPREMGCWHLASAVSLRAKGEKQAAYEKLAAAMRWFPQNPELLHRRARWQLADGEVEKALADNDAMLALTDQNVNLNQAHAALLWEAGKFKEAINDWKAIDQHSLRSGIPSRAEALNGLAYGQALADDELEEALENVNQSLDLKPDDAQVLDTRGYVYYRLKKYDLALADFDRAIERIEVDPELRGAAKVSAEREKRETEAGKADLEAAAPGVRAVAVIHYHRALALDALDRHDEAERENAFVRELIGREPDEKLY